MSLRHIQTGEINLLTSLCYEQRRSDTTQRYPSQQSVAQVNGNCLEGSEWVASKIDLHENTHHLEEVGQIQTPQQPAAGPCRGQANRQDNNQLTEIGNYPALPVWTGH